MQLKCIIYQMYYIIKCIILSHNCNVQHSVLDYYEVVLIQLHILMKGKIYFVCNVEFGMESKSIHDTLLKIKINTGGNIG